MKCPSLVQHCSTGIAGRAAYKVGVGSAKAERILAAAVANTRASSSDKALYPTACPPVG
jgi:Zn-dependent metalloprotease